MIDTFALNLTFPERRRSASAKVAIISDTNKKKPENFILPKFFARLGEKLRTSRSNSPNVAEYYSKRHGVTLRNTRSFTPNSMEQHSERLEAKTPKGGEVLQKKPENLTKQSFRACWSMTGCLEQSSQ